MTNRVQILRSPIVGNRPTSRQPGEPYVIFPENQFGVIDEGFVAHDLIGVPIFSASATYTAGQAVSHLGIIYVALVAVAAGVWNPAQWSAITPQSASGPFGQCYFSMLDATHVQLLRRNGSQIKINGTTYTIPAAGVSALITSCYLEGVASQTLAVATAYNVYVFNNAGTLTLDFSTTGHSADTTSGNEGVEIKTGDSTRSLVGKIRTLSPLQVADNVTQRLVLSWFNRRQKIAQASTASATTSSTSFVNANPQVFFLSWGDEDALCTLLGDTYNSSAATNSTQVQLDGSSSMIALVSQNTVTLAASFTAISGAGLNRFTEGFHYFWTQVNVNAGTGTWSFTTNLLFTG